MIIKKERLFSNEKIEKSILVSLMIKKLFENRYFILLILPLIGSLSFYLFSLLI